MTGLGAKKTCPVCDEEKEISNGNICKDCLDECSRSREKGFDHPDDHGSFVRTDERQDVLGSVEQCAWSLAQVSRSERAWKWVILSLHSALQGAMVCHLSGTAQHGALTNKSQKLWLVWHYKRQRGEITPCDQPPEDRLAGSSKLFKRLESSQIGSEVTERQKKAFKWLHDCRNDFTHFSPKAWSIERGSIEQTIGDVLDVICLITDNSDSFKLMTEEDRTTFRSKIEEIRSLLSKSSFGMS